jgi:hypothetical protein
MYKTGPSSGGVYDATIADGVIRAVLRNNATVQLSPEANGTVTWISADKSLTLTSPLIRVEDP